MATGSMIIVIASILTSGAAGSFILGSVQSTGNQATAVADDRVQNLVDGLVAVDATGHYSGNNLTELQFLMKLSPGSDSIDLAKIMIFVTTQYGETPYQFDNQHLLLLHQDIRLDQLYDPSEGRAPKVDDPRPEHPRRGRCDRQSGAADGPDNEHGVHGAGQPGKPVRHVQLKN